MIAVTDDVGKIFNDVLNEISHNIRDMMEELWLNWSHLGVDDKTKINNITKLVQIEKELHRDVISETRQKLKTMQGQVDKLKEETEELSRCLSVDITILDFKEDMMLVEYKRELEEQIAGYREQMEQRRMKMDRLLEWQRDLTDKLGVTIHELQEIPLPSEDELDKLKDHLEVLQAERDKRAEIFLTTQVEIKDIMEKLQIKPQNKFEQLVVTSLSVEFKVTDLNMDRLAKLKQDLQEKYEHTNNRVLELRERLSKLWDCLEEDHIYRDNFLQAHPGCHPQTEMAIKEEIKRCDQIKRQKISVFVANVRTKIKLMWDNVKYSTQQREEFVHYYQDIFTEDTLTLHELYLDKITKFYNDNKHIFDLVVTRRELWMKMSELEARATEPGRYHNRGGQLLREEKERKAIASNLPKIEAQIRDLVNEYEAKTGTIFTVDGKPLLQMMEDDWENRKAERVNKVSARKLALTPTTPSFRLATSPGKRNRTAAGLAATVDRNRPPSKRQLITSSATKAVTTIASNLSAFKRSAVSTVKRRISGRLAARATADNRGDNVKRKIDYAGEGKKTPKVAVNGSILKHKRTSHGRRRSNGRRSITANRSAHEETKSSNRDPLMETTLLTTYTDFKDGINEKQISRSSMAKGYEGTNGRRFRRAVDADKADIEAIVDRRYTEPLFGDVNIASIIELSTLSICMIDNNHEVIGFMAVCNHPNVPGVAVSDWEIWMRNMFQKFYLASNTLFIHFMYCIDTVTEVFWEEAIKSIFKNDVYLLHIVLIIPPKCPKECESRYIPNNKKYTYKYLPKRYDLSSTGIYLHTALRKDYFPKLGIRHAVEEDNDDIVQILGKNCPRLQELYGDFYISELISRHPDMNRRIIVAESHDHVVGVMCLNSDINYRMLQDNYELEPYFGLQKATPYEKELGKRNNKVLQLFGDPIMRGKWCPFTASKKETPSNGDVKDSKQRRPSKTLKASKMSRVFFQPDEVLIQTDPIDQGLSREMTDSITDSHFIDFFEITLGEDSFDYEIKQRRPSKTLKASKMSRVFFQPDEVLIQTDPIDQGLSREMTDSITDSHFIDFFEITLGEDSFDYEIVNIEKDLLTVPRVLSFDFLLPTESKKRISIACEKKECTRKRRLSLKPQPTEEDETMFLGNPNAFIIELFGLREDIDEIHAYELLVGAFETMSDYDYCLIRLPCAEKNFHLLQHFCFVPTKDSKCSKYALYVAHRCSVLGKLRVRRAEVIDIPQIANFLQNIQSNETIWTVENTILKKTELECYVFMSSLNLIGIGILESPEEINFLQTHFNVETYKIHAHHTKENPSSSLSMVKTVLVYPVFEPHLRFFARDMMRLSGCTTLMWLTAYRNRWSTHKANSMVGAMVPLLPRKSELLYTSTESNATRRMSDSIMAFSAWLLSKKITSIQKVNIDTRIVIVGASRTSMAFLNTLLFSDSSTYLLFTNVTLVSTHGLPYSRDTNPHADMMFNYFRTNSDKYLKSVPYTYYINVIQAQMVDIDKREKYVQLSNGSKCYYDLLLLLFGKQYQHPHYLKDIKGIPKSCTSDVSYKRLDVPRIDSPIVDYAKAPRNLFIINALQDANRALSFINSINWHESHDKIIVYGCTHNAYCCLATLIDMKVPARSIIFVEPFPDVNPKKTRVPLFYNVYVDRTVQEYLRKLKINVYRSFYFHSWTLGADDFITHVDFSSHYKMIKLQCSAFFYYGKQEINEQAFIALNKSGIVYDGGILIDHRFRTHDPSIFAAGPVTRYHRRYYADSKRQRHYDAYEIGIKLGTQIRNHLDPLFPESQKVGKKRSTVKWVSFDISSKTEDHEGSGLENCTKHGNIQNDLKTPNFKSPIVIHCSLPGSLKYLDVRPPGKKTPHHYVQSLQYNGYVLETFRGGYFKLHMSKDLKVDGITCLTTEHHMLENFKNIYGLSSTVLNNVFLRYMSNRLDNFYEFFESPWASFLYYDLRDEIFATVNELLPKGQKRGETLEEALHRLSKEMDTPSMTNLQQLRSRFEKSQHFEAITEYMIEWLSENESVMPMYLNPHLQSKLVHDPNMNNTFKKKKRSIIKIISNII